MKLISKDKPDDHKKGIEMIELFIDDRPVRVEEGTTVLKAAEKVGIHIPHLCFHDAFPPIGSCRMCLVEIEGHPCLELACSTQVKQGMKVYTQTENVREARKGVLEFLLAEHPMDCPICDKAGECKLQDYYQEYGLFESRFHEKKERKDKKVDIGKGLILDRERCILCTRCVRFLKDITKTNELGVFNRGIQSEIGIFDGQFIDNNYAGNLVELCPVGAITDRDFRFKTRAWFLKKGPTICPLCSRGCNIFVEYHPGFAHFEVPQRVYRITSRVTSRDKSRKEQGYWICDIGRYGYSYMDKDRLEAIVTKNGNHPIDKKKAVQYIGESIQKFIYKNEQKRIGILLNTWLTNEELFLIKKIFIQEMKLENVFFTRRARGEKDDFLITEDRTPNTKGAEEIGFQFKEVEEGSLDGIELFIAFLSSPFDSEGSDELIPKLRNIKTKILFTPFQRKWNDAFDWVLPTTVSAERGGSFTNIDGRVQHFGPVLSPRGEAQAEWEWLVSLGNELDIDFEKTFGVSSPLDIFKILRDQIEFFQRIK